MGIRDVSRPLNYSRFGAVFASANVIVPLVLVFVLNILIDPYGEYRLFGAFVYRSDYTSAFPMVEKLSDNRYTLVFGTSTSAPIDKAAVGGDVLNFSLSLYGQPEAIYRFLETLKPEQVSHIEKIYFAVEYNSFSENAPQNMDVDYTSKKEFYWRTILNIQRPKIVAALDWIVKTVTGKADSVMTEFGVYKHLRRREYGHVEYQRPIEFGDRPRQISFLRKIAAFCRRQEIDFVVFRTVTTRHFLEHVDFASMRRQFEGILKAVGEFYLLMWLDGISDDTRHFRDPVHPSYDTMLREMAILQSSEGRRYLVTRGNLDAHMRVLASKAGR